MNNQQRLWLEDKFDKRANFNPTERRLYSHDIAAIAGLFKPLIGKTIPNAVVQPKNEHELIELVRWANQNSIPLVPRGKGSSGYGGIIPTRKGIVVDFYRMKNVISVDTEKQTVTVEPGITWEQLDKEIKSKGLVIRLYPTSYPSSSAGGWLAQGGAGIGSYEYGWFSENVEGARIVLPSGEVKNITGDELELVADAEGITGFISQLTIRVQKLADIGVTAIACPDAYALSRIFQDFIDKNLPIWSLVFINPRMAEMKNRSPVQMHHGKPAEHKIILPAAYIATVAYRKEDEEEIQTKLPEIVKKCEGEILKQEIADQLTWFRNVPRFRFRIIPFVADDVTYPDAEGAFLGANVA